MSKKLLFVSVPWTCSFENNNNCGFFPYSANDFEWMVGRPPVGSARGGSSKLKSKLNRFNLRKREAFSL